MRVIHWKKQAINDLINIGQYIAKDSPAHADKMIFPPEACRNGGVKNICLAFVESLCHYICPLF